LRKQYYEISNGNIEHAHQLNYEYRKKKERFEINLILFLLKKYENFSKPGSKVKIVSSEPYQELKREAQRLVERFRKASTQDKFFLNEVRNESLNYITNFIKRIEKAVDDRPVKSNEVEVRQFKNYTKWKKKISELVNIWELFQSNGIDMKFPVKYLILKRYLTYRGTKRSASNENADKSNDKTSDLNTSGKIGKMLRDFFYGVSSKYVPRSVIMPDEIFNSRNCDIFAFNTQSDVHSDKPFPRPASSFSQHNREIN
jgi:hypothetical protein